MSKDWVADIHNMHDYYGMHAPIEKMSPKHLKALIEFRLGFLQEELNEMSDSVDAADSDGVVDALIDLCVVAIGTLDLYNVDASEAWDRVLDANMRKTPGIKASRPNPLGLPDLIKPEGWVAPTHTDNCGMLDRIEYYGDDEVLTEPDFVPTGIVK